LGCHHQDHAPAFENHAASGGRRGDKMRRRCIPNRLGKILFDEIDKTAALDVRDDDQVERDIEASRIGHNLIGSRSTASARSASTVATSALPPDEVLAEPHWRTGGRRRKETH
jgi:hypothetical protein